MSIPLIDFLGELGSNQQYTAEEIQEAVTSGGQTIRYVIRRVVAENGELREAYKVVVPTATGASTYIGTGLGILALEVPTAIAMIGGALGVAAGATILSRTDLFQNVGTKIGESLYCFIHSDGTISIPQETIDAYAQVFIENNALQNEINIPQNADIFREWGYPASVDGGDTFIYYQTSQTTGHVVKSTINLKGRAFIWNVSDGVVTLYVSNSHPFSVTETFEDMTTHETVERTLDSSTEPNVVLTDPNTGNRWEGYDITITTPESTTSYFSNLFQAQHYSPTPTPPENISVRDGWRYYFALGTIITSVQPSAVTVTTTPIEFPTIYPNWTPTIYDPDNPENPDEDDPDYILSYPIEVPSGFPDTETPQPEVQDPAPMTVPSTDPRTTQLDDLIQNLPVPFPYQYPTPKPEPDPDPSTQVSPDSPLNPDQKVPSSPASANVDPNPTTTIPLIPSVTTSGSKLFTVYNPSFASLDALGAYLWSANIIDIIKSIWQNPMDGIISYHILYATPTVGETKQIYLGLLAAGAYAPVVTNQFIEIDCGEIHIEEFWENIADYSPYTKLTLYLPFIGFVDLNVDDVMGYDDGGGYLKVTYRVDVYTGTCIAQVWVRRSVDLTESQILYTFSGNCSQQMPLTGVTYQGLMQTLLSASTAFATSGISAGLAAGINNFGGHHQTQLQRSGSMSSNAGVLGQRKPYLIISRNNVYYATNFSEYYGYPAHSTVILGNLSGYVRVRDIKLTIPATSDEIAEIEFLLKEGVWF